MAVSVHKWLLNKFRDINHSRMDKHIDIIAKNSGKSKAYIKFDIIRNFLIRGTGYTDYFRCDFINLSAKEKKTFVTAKTFYKILEYLNDEEYIVQSACCDCRSYEGVGATDRHAVRGIFLFSSYFYCCGFGWGRRRISSSGLMCSALGREE